MNGSVCLQCLRADVRSVRLALHFDQWDRLLLSRFLTPECFDFQMLHLARATPLHHATCGVRVCANSEWHKTSDLPKELLQLYATHLPGMQCTSPLGRWKDDAQRCRVEHRFSQRDNGTIPFAVIETSRTCGGLSTGNVHARCGLCTRHHATRRARGREPCVA